ncbi:hypothetical protein DFH11DRAFT_1505783 [Phellopilus nigrolimitatus]|nr:hypothetical protein DFH11DRAFT_1505783 [Phellopilus nigrolimitatus]
MIKHDKYWLDGNDAVIIIVDGVLYKVNQSLLSRQSPQFFDICCRTPKLDLHLMRGLFRDNTLVDGKPSFVIKTEIGVSKADFDSLIARLHESPLESDAPFLYWLRLYIVSAPSKCDFKEIHHAAMNSFRDQVLYRPLEIGFDDWELLKRASLVAGETSDFKLRNALSKALYYSYTIHPDISFEEKGVDSTNLNIASGETLEDSLKSVQISGSEAALSERLMTLVSDHFSPILFQPPGALHMECTDVYAGLWMERAVQPAFDGDGMANPFATLRRLRELDWKREVDAGSGDRTEPCNECLQQKKIEWAEEAETIWRLMDDWVGNGN